MAEKSRFWNGTVLGDAVVAPYDADREFADVMQAVAGAAGLGYRLLLFPVLNSLAVTGSSSPLSVATGQAMVDGTWYENDAAVSVTVPTPAASTRFDWIVLEKDWATQTVRIVRVGGVEGAGAPPALTQTLGTKWQAPIYYYSITTGGVIALVDQRVSIGDTYRAIKTYENAACQVRKNADQDITVSGAGAWVAVTWQTEDIDTASMHSTVSDTSRINVGEAGRYEVHSRIMFEALAGGSPYTMTGGISLRKNGVGTDLDSDAIILGPAVGAASTGYYSMEIDCLLDLAAGDYLEVYAAFAGSPSAMNLVDSHNAFIAGQTKMSVFSVRRVA